MSKSKKEQLASLTNQLDLLSEEEPTAGSLDIDAEFRESLSAIISRSGLSRFQIVAAMSELTGQEITKSMLDNYTSASHKDHKYPAIFVPAITVVCRGFDPLRVLGKHSKCVVLESKEARFAMIAKLEKQKEKLEREISRLKSY